MINVTDSKMGASVVGPANVCRLAPPVVMCVYRSSLEFLKELRAVSLQSEAAGGLIACPGVVTLSEGMATVVAFWHPSADGERRVQEEKDEVEDGDS